MQHPDHKLVSIVKGTDPQYVSFIRLGYNCIFSGMRQAVEKKQEEIMQQLCTGLLGSDSASVASHSCTAVKK